MDQLASKFTVQKHRGIKLYGAQVYSKSKRTLSDSDLEGLRCSDCDLLLRDPMQLINCGHRYCRPCIQGLTVCVIDSEEIDQDAVRQDKGCQKELVSLHLDCPFVKKGCDWKLQQFMEFEDHIESCPYATLTGTPNGKEEAASAVEIPDTEEICPFPGCNTMLNLASSGEHYYTTTHLHKGMSLIFQTQKMVNDLTRKFTARENVTTVLLKEKDTKLRFQEQEISRLKSVLAEQNAVIRLLVEKTKLELPPALGKFSSGGEGMAGQSQDQIGRHEEVSFDSGFGVYSPPLQSTSLSTGGVSVPVSESGASTDDLQAQLAVGELQEVVMKQTSQLKEHAESIRSIQESIRTQSETMDEVRLRQDILEVKTTTGLLIWKIPEIKTRYQEAQSHITLSLYSPPFHTSPHGYRMCIRVYLNGDGTGKGSHISLFFVLMKSEQDNLLRWPFMQAVTFTLINQTTASASISETFLAGGHSPSFQQPQNEMNVASGFPCFASQSVLSDQNFTKDDVIFIKCQVDLKGLDCV